MQMQIPHSLVVLVVSLGLFASGSPTLQGGCFEQVAVPVEVVNTCPQPEVISIKTVYRTVKELVPDCGCTDDFTDFANVQLIADTACRNGLVFSPGLKTRKRGIFERAPACQSFSIVEKPQQGALRRRDSGGLSDAIHERFDSVKDTFKHNVDQNINNNGNIDENETQASGSGSGGFGGFPGFGGFGRKAKRNFGGFGGFGGGFDDGGDFDDNDNQNINQNVNANQNLMANLGRFNSFFGDRGDRRGGDRGEILSAGLNGLGFGNNDNTDFNVNNNVAFEDDGFFKNKRSLGKRCGFGGGCGGFDDGDFDDNNNQNINQNINNNQNLNQDFFSGVFGGNDDGFGDFGNFGFFPGFIGGFGGCGFGGCGFDNGGEMNENFNVNPNTNIERFGGEGHRGFDGFGRKHKRNLGNANVNFNSNINNNANSGAFIEEVEVPVQFETVLETVPYIETIPVVETAYQPVVEYETVEYIDTVPVYEQFYEPVQVIEQVARPAVAQNFQPIIPQLKAAVLEDKFNFGTSCGLEVCDQVAQPVNVVESVAAVQAQPVVEVFQPIEVVSPVEVITPIAVEVQPIIEYEAVFYDAPGCGVPNYPSYSLGSCGN